MGVKRRQTSSRDHICLVEAEISSAEVHHPEVLRFGLDSGCASRELGGLPDFLPPASKLALAFLPKASESQCS